MATKLDLTAFNGELFNSKKSLTATKHRTAHGKIYRYVVRNKETFLLEIKKRFCSYSACVAYTKTIIHLSVGPLSTTIHLHFGE